MTVYSCFKYRSLSTFTFQGLENSELYFCPPGALNDPHDCNVDLERIVRGMLFEEALSDSPTLKSLYEDKSLLRGLRQGASTLGICSYSLIHNSTLMWAHYAANHTGICLRYDFPESFLADDQAYPFMGTSAVTYDDNAVSDWIRENIGLYKESREKFGMALSQRLLISKGKDWEYEQEVRTIAMHQGTLSIPPEYLTHVIFGLKASQEDKDRVYEIISRYAHPIKVGEVVRTQSDFGLDIVEI